MGFGGYPGNRHSNTRWGSCEGLQSDMGGSGIKSIKKSGSQSDKDAACCAACQANDSCEAWVQATDGDSCWLKKITSSNNKRNSGIKSNSTAWEVFNTFV